MTKSRDYYKILGVRESATEEEIRERWIKLNRRFHPDHEAEKGVGEERLREINEAYHILKHSSTRVQYDLRKAYDSKKKTASVRRRFILAATLILVPVSGFIYSRMSQTDKRSDMEASRTASPPGVADRTISDGRDGSKALPGVALSEPEKQAKTERAVPKSLPRHEVAAEAIPSASSEPVTKDMSPAAGSPTQRPSRSMTNAPLPMTGNLTQRRDDTATQPRNDAVVMSSDATTQGPKDPMTILRTEVGEFLSRYAERYVERDIEGFLSLFSSRAVLNRKDELGGIRRIYTHFFDESSELRYRLRDLVVEVDQAGLEVKALFEVDQILRRGGERKIWRGKIRWFLSRENDAFKIVTLDYQYQ